MSWSRLWVCSCLLSLSLWTRTRALELEELFEFGEAAGDQRLQPGSDSTAELPLSGSLFFFSETFDKVYVSWFNHKVHSSQLDKNPRSRATENPVRVRPGFGSEHLTPVKLKRPNVCSEIQVFHRIQVKIAPAFQKIYQLKMRFRKKKLLNYKKGIFKSGFFPAS